MPIVATHVLLPPPLALLPLLPQPATASAPIAVAAMITLPFMDTPLHFSGYLESSGFKPGWPRKPEGHRDKCGPPGEPKDGDGGRCVCDSQPSTTEISSSLAGNDRASRATGELTAEAAGIHVR